MAASSSSSAGGGGEREPSVLTPDEIKSEVFSFIRDKSADKNFDIKDLTKSTIYKVLKEMEGISKKSIDEALSSLVNDKALVKKEFHYIIYIPESRVSNISHDDRQYMSHTIFAQLAIGVYFLFILLLIFKNLPTQIANFFGAGTDSSKFWVFAILGIIFSYYVGQQILSSLKFINDYMPKMMRYQNVVIPFVIILIPVILIWVLGIFVLKEKPTMTHILTSVAMIITGGIGWLNYKKDKK